MALVQTVNESMFRDAFLTMDRGEQFSYDALGILFSYLDEMSNETEDNTELDVIAICCEYDEDTPEAIAGNYSFDISGFELPEQWDKMADFVEEKIREQVPFLGRTGDGKFVYPKW